MKIFKTIISGYFAAFLLALPALGNPSGEQVVSGSAAFDRNNPSVLNITTGERVIINWQDFSINPGEMTKFIQPGANSAALNRVISGNPSAILGTLSANGQIFLINPNGVLVGQGAHINTAGFVASTLDVNNENFMSGGDLNFVGDSTAKVVNLGKINTSSGDIVLLGRQVENRGELNAANGGVYMAAGREVLLAEKGKDRVFVKAGHNSGPVAGDGVVNSGSINAMHADLQAQGNIYAYAINNQGNVHATGAVKEGGRVKLTAGGIGSGAGNIINSGNITADNSGEVLIKGQNVTTTDTSKIKAKTTTASRQSKVKIDSEDTTLVSGQIDASSTTDKGGSIQITGMKVGALGLRADASGQTGGGEILVGGDYQGKNPEVKNAQMTTVTADTEIIADAKDSGDGGKVVVWADDTTRFLGKISARGGINGGNGGFAEVSGKENLVYRGLADLRAFDGKTGTLLLDPKNITVSGIPGAVNAAFTNTVNNLFGNDPSLDYTFLASDIVSNLNLASMVLQANNDITIATDIIATNGANDLTLQAGRSIFIGQASEATIMLGGAFTAIANDNDGAVVLAEREAGAGGFFMLPDSVIDTSLNGGDITIEVREGAGAGQQSGNILLSDLNAGLGYVAVTNSGNTDGSSILMSGVNQTILANTVDLVVTSQTPGSNQSGAIGASNNPISIITGTAGVGARGEGGGIYLASAPAINSVSTNVDLHVRWAITTNGGNIVLTSAKPGTILYAGFVSNLSGGTTTLIADSMNIASTVYSTDRINVFPANNVIMRVGATNFALGVLSLSQGTLDNFITPVLQLGASNVSSMTIDSPVSFASTNVHTLTLKSGGAITANELLTVSNLAFEANGAVNFGKIDPPGPLMDVTRVAGRTTGAAGIQLGNAGTNLIIGEVDGYKGLRTQNGSIGVEQENGSIIVSHTVTGPTEFDIDAGNAGLNINMKNPTNGVSSNGFFTLAPNAYVRAGSASITAAEINISSNSLLLIGNGGTLTADRMDFFGSVSAPNVGSEILLNTFTKGGSVTAIAMNGLFGTLSPINNGYPATPVATFTVQTVDGNGSGLTLAYLQNELSPGNFSYDIFLDQEGSGYTEAPTITWTPPPGGGVAIKTEVAGLSDGRSIVLGSKGAYVPGTAGALYLNQQDLDNISAGNVRVGDTASGQISLAGDITISAFDTLSLKTRADITGTGRITVENLDLFATRGVTLTGENNVQTVTGNLRQNTFTFNNAGSFAVGAAGIQTAVSQINVQLMTTSGDIHLSGPVSSGAGSGSIFIRANNGLFSNSSSGTINAGQSTVTIESDTIQIGGSITANAAIYLRPNNSAANISINDALADYNLTAAQLLLLNSDGGVEIGRSNGTGNVSIGSAGSVNLSGKTYDLTIYGGSLTNRGNLTLGASQEFFAFVDAISILSNITAQGGITLAPRSDFVGIGLNDALGAFNLSEQELQQLTTSFVIIGRNTGTGSINIGSLGSIDLSSANSSLLLMGSASPVSFNFQNSLDTFQLSSTQSFTIHTGGNIFNSGLNNVDITIGGANSAFGIGNYGAIPNPAGSVDIRTSVANLSGARSTGSMSIRNTTNLNVIGTVNSSNNDIFLSAGGGTLTSSSNGTINAGSASVTIESGSLNLLRTVTGTNSINLRPHADNVSIGINDTNGTFQLTAGSFGNLITTNVNIGRPTGTAPIYIGGLGTINLSARNMGVNLLGTDSDIIFNFTGNNSLILQNNRTFVFNTGGNISNPGGSTRDITIGGVGTIFINNAKNVDLTTSVGRLGGSTNTGSFSIVNNTVGQFAIVGDVLIQGSGVYGTNTISAGQGDLFVNRNITSTNGALHILARNGVQITAGNTVDTQGGGYYVHADTDANGIGQYVQAAGTLVNTSGGTNEIIAANVVLLGNINAGTGDVTLRPSAPSTVNAGTDLGGSFVLDNDEIGRIASTGLITIGDRGNTTNLIADGITAGAKNIRLRSGGNINDNGPVAVTTTGFLVLDAAGSIGSTTTFNASTPRLSIITEGDVLDVTSATTLTDLNVQTDGTVTNQSIADGGNLTYSVTEDEVTKTTTITDASVGAGSLNFAYTNTAGGINLSDINTGTAGNLILNANGTIQQVGGPLLVGGDSLFIALAGSDIILNNVANTFQGAVGFTNNGIGLLNNITVFNTVGLSVGPLNITGDLNISANGITQAGALIVGGAASFDGGSGNDLILNTFTNQMGGISIVSADNATILNQGNTTLGASAVSSDLNLQVLAGDISNNGTFVVGGNSTFTADAGRSVAVDFAGNTFLGTVSFAGNGGNLMNVSITDTTALDLQALSLGGNLTVNSGGALTQSGALSGQQLTLTSADTITLDNPANAFTSLGTISRGGNFTYVNNGSLAINGAINSGNLLSSVLIQVANGTLTLNQNIATDGAGNDINLVSDTAFINNAGAGALTPVNGSRYLVYSVSPLANTLGGLTPAFEQYNIVFPALPTDPINNGVLYSLVSPPPIPPPPVPPAPPAPVNPGDSGDPNAALLAQFIQDFAFVNEWYNRTKAKDSSYLSDFFGWASIYSRYGGGYGSGGAMGSGNRKVLASFTSFDLTWADGYEELLQKEARERQKRRIPDSSQNNTGNVPRRSF